MHPDLLRRGLDALAHAADFNYFLDGHRGGAVVSAWFFNEEGSTAADVDGIHEAMITREYLPMPQFEPFPGGPAVADAEQRILAAMTPGLSELRQAGHNIILPTLALKALRRLPEAATESRVAGICRLAECFTEHTDVPESRLEPLPEPSDAPAFGERLLEEWLACMDRFDGRGQGWSGHLLTTSRAVLDLEELGHHATARQALGGLAQYVRRVRQGPLDSDQQHQEHARHTNRPDELAYWQARQDRQLGFGHLLKYPYGFAGLAAAAHDDALLKRCSDAGWRVF